MHAGIPDNSYGMYRAPEHARERPVASVALVTVVSCALLLWQHARDTALVRRPAIEAVDSTSNASLPAALRLRVSSAHVGLSVASNTTNTTTNTTADDGDARETSTAADAAAADDIWMAWAGFVGLVTLVSFCCRPSQCRGLTITKGPGLDQYRPLAAHEHTSHARGAPGVLPGAGSLAQP